MIRLTLILALALLPPAAQADETYAQQWPLQLSRADAGAYRVPLDAAVYRAAYWPDLRDVRVLDAHGKPVASLLQPAQPAQEQVRIGALRWFVLPASAAAARADLSVIVQRDTDGTVLLLRDLAAAGAAPPGGAGWLVDLGADSTRLQALRLDWGEGDAAVDAGYRLEGSDDLRAWRILDPQVRLVQLRNQGQELRSNRIALDAPPRYLRLLPLQAGTDLALREVRGEWREPSAPAGWRWLELAAAPVAPTEGGGFVYRLQGRYPVQRVDVAMPANSSVRWSVFSRDGEIQKGQSDPPVWKLRAAGWNAWRLDDAGAARQSPPLDLHYVITDRAWRLQSETGAGLPQAPVLRLGYVPGSLVFLDQGTPPYVLVSGSASDDVAQAAVEPMLEALRGQQGAQWQPALATLGAPSERAGAAAYTPAPRARDWKTLTLWGVLVLGALVVGGIALSLLREGARPPRG